jgi:hypothetical protein
MTIDLHPGQYTPRAQTWVGRKGRIRYTVPVLQTWLFHRHLEEDEEILRVVHKHWLLGVRHLFLPVLVLVALIAVLGAAFSKPVLIVISSLSVVTLLWLLRNFYDYYLDAWIITNTGIIDIEWHGWFHRQSSRVLFSDLQGVSYEIQGVWGTLLRFGTISVEKISTGSEISMPYVSNPRSVERLILQGMEDYIHTKNLKDASVVQELLATMVAREVQRKDLPGK